MLLERGDGSLHFTSGCLSSKWSVQGTWNHTKTTTSEYTPRKNHVSSMVLEQQEDLEVLLFFLVAIYSSRRKVVYHILVIIIGVGCLCE